MTAGRGSEPDCRGPAGSAGHCKNRMSLLRIPRCRFLSAAGTRLEESRCPQCPHEQGPAVGENPARPPRAPLKLHKGAVACPPAGCTGYAPLTQPSG